MQELIAKAKETIEKHYIKDQHTVGAALRAKDGKFFISVNVRGQKMDLCSEWSAITQALMNGALIEMAVALHRDSDGNFQIYPPCGLCRELFAKYWPEAKIIVSADKMVRANELLPDAWTREAKYGASV